MFSRVHGATPGRGHVTVLGRQPADLPVRTHLAAPGPASRRGRQRRRCYPAHGSRGLRREEGRRDGRQRQQDGHGRFERLGRRAEESVRRGLQGLRDAKRQDRHRQHRRPQHVPREHQPVPTGFAGFSDAFKAASVGEDGKMYFVPYYLYHWAVFYRPSLWKEKGYTAPKTWDEYKALATKMKADGLVPIAFADKDGWPAMGTFDYVNMRTNGYDFHINLMRGKESWTDPKVKKTFDTWASILPLCQEGSLGRTWQEGAQALQKKQAGMHVLGMFLGNQFSESERADLDYFLFPEIDPAHGQTAIEAPIDGFLMTAKAKNKEGARDLLKYLATPKAEDLYLKSDPNNVAANGGADTSSYSALQKRAAETIANAKNISQFLDRDTRPDFSSTVMIPAIQRFINAPKDIDPLLKDIEAQKKNIFASE